MDRPATTELKPVDVESVSWRPVGKLRVRMSTCAPEKSPGRSGVNVLEVVMDWSIPLGNMSIGTILRSGSGLGRRAPLSAVVV
jgi:hypothetical protein